MVKMCGVFLYFTMPSQIKPMFRNRSQYSVFKEMIDLFKQTKQSLNKNLMSFELATSVVYMLPLLRIYIPRVMRWFLWDGVRRDVCLRSGWQFLYAFAQSCLWCVCLCLRGGRGSVSVHTATAQTYRQQQQLLTQRHAIIAWIATEPPVEQFSMWLFHTLCVCVCAFAQAAILCARQITRVGRLVSPVRGHRTSFDKHHPLSA